MGHAKLASLNRNATVTCEGARHDARKLMMVIFLEMFLMVQEVMHGLHVEALFDFGEGSSNDMQRHHQCQKRCASCTMPQSSDGADGGNGFRWMPSPC